MSKRLLHTARGGDDYVEDIPLPFRRLWAKVVKLGHKIQRLARNIRTTEECLRNEIELAKRIERRHHTDSTTDIRKLRGRQRKLERLAATGCRNVQWSLLNPGSFAIPQDEWYRIPFSFEVLAGYGVTAAWEYKPELQGGYHISAFLYLEVTGAVDDYKLHLAVFKNGEYHLPLSVRGAWKIAGENAFYELNGTARVFLKCDEYLDIRLYYDATGDSIQKPGNCYKVVGHVEVGYDHCCGSQPLDSPGDYISTIILP